MRPDSPTFVEQTKGRAVDVTLVQAVGGHGGYSEDVATLINSHALVAPTAQVRAKRIIAICTYTPSFFCDKIIPIAKRDRGALADVRNFQQQCRSWSLPEDVDTQQHEKAHDAFDKATLQEFRHFTTLRQHGMDVLRLCCFRQAPALTRTKREKQSDGLDCYMGGTAAVHWPEYFAWFGRHNKPHACYAFFRWLCAGCDCYVVPPNCWAQWGLATPRDCAIIDNKYLVELFPEYEAYVLAARQAGDVGWEWPFLAVSLLMTRVESGGYDQLWTAQEFLKHVEDRMDRAGQDALAAVKNPCKQFLTQLTKHIPIGTTKKAANRAARMLKTCEDEARIVQLRDFLQAAVKLGADKHTDIEQKLRDWAAVGEV